jgi:hypothetical protein
LVRDASEELSGISEEIAENEEFFDNTYKRYNVIENIFAHNFKISTNKTNRIKYTTTYSPNMKLSIASIALAVFATTDKAFVGVRQNRHKREESIIAVVFYHSFESHNIACFLFLL